MTTRLKRVITSVDGETDQFKINQFVDNMLSKDSIEFRRELSRVSPDIQLSQEVELGGDVVKVDIPLTTDFFWPKTTT